MPSAIPAEEKCGDHVRVKSGPFPGLEGILVREKNLCRLVLSIEIPSRSVAVEMEMSEVERLSSSAILPSCGTSLGCDSLSSRAEETYREHRSLRNRQEAETDQLPPMRRGANEFVRARGRSQNSGPAPRLFITFPLSEAL
jgi:hypothetical protein